ncbi:MAG TPA: A/G-specific adenine glycosylase [Candidatus Paceibacterota bacterium]|nr:A/G-specific adenine glycosylase [Candidatus Paceibacterota bacterium]
MKRNNVKSFQLTVWSYWKENGRHDLPWRKTKNPYKILVSEVMLQQTQVPRVIEKYKSFLKKFPTVRALAKAPLSAVLKEWSGLGYNRRGKYLHDAAKEIVGTYRGNFKEALKHPPARTTVQSGGLPGVGPYTRSAVKVFAFNEPEVLLETNVRTAITHHFFQNKKNVKDESIRTIAELAAKGQDPRTWQSALFDYGSFLKRSGVRNNHRSAHYTKQSKFDGSLRQVRGAILRELQNGPKNQRALHVGHRMSHMFEKALEGLARDGLIKKEKGKWRIA